MTSMAKAFASCKARNRTALIPFLTAGFPDESTFPQLLCEFEHSGADMIVIGFAFSDPLADGPTIQYASQKALAGGMTVEKTFRLLQASNGVHVVPRIVMSYYNPVRAYGFTRFAERAREVGVSGLIIPDLVCEEGSTVERICRETGINLIYLLARTSSPARRKQILSRSRGFVYLVSVMGVTGARTTFPKDLLRWIKQVKMESPLPVCVGFGISNPDQAGNVSRVADGVIIGSAIIDVIRRASGRRQIYPSGYT